MGELETQSQFTPTAETSTGFKRTELGPFPEEWEVTQLGDILEEISVRVRDFPADGAGEFPVLSLTKNEGLILQSERFGKRIATENVDDYKVVRRGEIVYNPYVIWEGAVHALWKHEHGLVSPVYAVWEARPGLADPYFVDTFLRTPLAIAAYNRFAAGAVNRRRAIRKKDFLSIEAPLPPLSEQKTIAHVLRTVQEAKEATEQVIAATRELKLSLMRHLFTYGPVPVDEAERVPLKETEIGPVPEHWEVVELGGAVTQAQYGLSKRGETHGAYPILRMNNLKDGRVDFESKQYVDLDEQTVTKYRLRKGDLLFNRTNSYDLVGKTGLFDLDGDYVFASYLVRVATDESRLIPEYANYYLNWAPTQARLKLMASRGVSQSNINATKLKSLLVPLPSLSEQLELARSLSTVDKTIAAEDNRKRTLEVLFKTLLHNLMTGKVRVKDLDLSKVEGVA